jgi:hypothetical protein
MKSRLGEAGLWSVRKEVEIRQSRKRTNETGTWKETTRLEGDKMKRRSFIVVAVAVASLGFGLAPAGAQPSQNASCVALIGTHGELGNPGEYQRTEHDPSFGQRSVKFVALLENCTE